jgi:cytoskeletal protein CcmA (bactofilin family)
MTVSISNTNLNDNFNTWRLNTNLAATVISNNVVTVSRAGSANRGGTAYGNGHIKGTFSANELRTATLKSGNTTSEANWIIIASNTFINATSVSITANTIFQGNVDFVTSGTDRLTLGNISRIRMTGGSGGQVLKKSGTDQLVFSGLTLRDVADLSTNSAPIILSGANTSFSDNNDSPALILSNGTDRAYLFMASDATLGDSDVYLKLVDAVGDSKFVIADSSNSEVFSVTSGGITTFSSNIAVSGVASSGNILPDPAGDDSYNLGAPNREWKDLYIDGVANIDELSLGTSAGQGVSTSMIPKTDAAGNLGSSTRKWGTMWADTTNGGAGVFNTLGVSSTVTANGATTFNGTATFNSTATIASNFVMSGNVASDIVPNTVDGTGQYDLGSTSQRFHNVYANNAFANNITTDNDVSINGDLTVQGTATFASGAVTAPSGTYTTLNVTGATTLDGTVDLGDNSSDLISVLGVVDTNIIPTGTVNLGSLSAQWNSAWFDGTVTTDFLTVDENASITGTLASGNTDINGTLDVSEAISNDGTVVVGKNGKLHANNAVTDGTIQSAMLANTMNIGAGGQIHGSASKVPIIRVNKYGQVIGISNTSVAGVTGFTYTDANNTFVISTADGNNFSANVTIAEGASVTNDGSKKGLASFDSTQFSVSNGHVSLAGGASGAITQVTGTANEIQITRDGANAYFGLPDDVTVTGQLNVGENLVVAGNLTVSGTTTTINAETLNLADNKVVLNSNYSGSTPTEDAGFVVERGTKQNYEFIWDESEGRWTAGDRNLVANTFIGNLTGNVTGNADTADAFANAINFSLTGDVTAPAVSFTGADGVQMNVTISNTAPSIIRVYDVSSTQVFP